MNLFGYLDPATGSLFIQVVIGGALAGGVAFRGYILNIVSKLRLVAARQKAAE